MKRDTGCTKCAGFEDAESDDAIRTLTEVTVDLSGLPAGAFATGVNTKALEMTLNGVQITLSDTTGNALNLRGGDIRAAQLTVTNGNVGLVCGDATLTLRNSVFAGQGLANVLFNQSCAGDLGTTTGPGGNTFSVPSAASANLLLTDIGVPPAQPVTAMGNFWQNLERTTCETIPEYTGPVEAPLRTQVLREAPAGTVALDMGQSCP